MGLKPKTIAKLAVIPVSASNAAITYTILSEEDVKHFNLATAELNTVILNKQRKRTKIVDVPLEAQPSRFEPAKERSQGNSDPGGEGNAED